MKTAVTRRDACAFFGMSESTFKILRRVHKDTFPIACGVEINAPVYKLAELMMFMDQYAPKWSAKLAQRLEATA